MSDDQSLLKQFMEDQSQVAFAALVQRYVNLVYSAALRQLGGDAHLAWDASQGVFLALAQSAPRLVNHAALSGWLYTSTRFICAKLVRTRQRAHAREQAASAMNEIIHEGVPEPDWCAVRPVLDAAMHDLGAGDREALLLRHFEGRSFAEIGRVRGIGENAARMRVERALEKLRSRLARRGITSTAVALGTVLTAHGVTTAPAGLASAAATLAFAGATTTAAGSAGALAWLQFMSATNLKVGATVVLVALALGSYIGAEWQRGRAPTAVASTAMPQTRALAALREESARPASRNRAVSASDSSGGRGGSSGSQTAAAENAFAAGLDPATQKMLAVSARRSLDQRYGSLFRRLKLPSAELERFRDLLAEREVSGWDTLGVAQSQGINLAANPAEWKAVMEKVRTDLDGTICAFLGNERYKQYQDYNENASSYLLLELLERRLSYTNSPLRDSQSEPLLHILMDPGLSVSVPPTFAHGPFAGAVDALSVSDPIVAAVARGPVSDETIAQAQSILTPSQIEILRQIQSEQRSQADAMQVLNNRAAGAVTDNAKAAPATQAPGARPSSPP